MLFRHVRVNVPVLVAVLLLLPCGGHSYARQTDTFILGVPPPPRRAFPADVLRGFLVALHDHPTGAESLPYLAPDLRLEVAAGRSLASVVGFPTDYDSFCLAAYDPAAGHRLLLATLTYAHERRQEDALLLVVPDNGALEILDFHPHSDAAGPLASWATPVGCTTVAAAASGPVAMPATGGGGGIEAYERLLLR